MAVWCRCTGLLLGIFLILIVNVENSKLNVPRVLLPIFKQFSTNFTLEVTESGCYKWSSSRCDVVQVTPIDVDPELGCSTHAIVSAVSKDESRNSAIIFAEEVHSGQMLRCDVIVDVISNLNIVTTTRELYMEESPEAFEVRAYDDQGNEFSTLEGVEFQWSLGNLNTKSDTRNTVLRFITFRDSPYETPSTIETFEQMGLRGHMVLLEGIKTGSAKVSVRLPHQEYQDVKSIEVQLMVVANLIIDPADVYIMLGDTVHYHIRQVQHGKLVDIEMPSTQYYLEIEDCSIASMAQDTSIALGSKLGRTKILLHDRNVDEQDAGIRVPTAQLTVVDASYLTLAILPHRNWALMMGENYEIVVEIYDRNDHKLLLGAGVQVRTTIPSHHFHVMSSTANNTHHSGTPAMPGTAPVKAALEGVRNPITAQAEMSVYDRIVVRPDVVVLPWDPDTRTKYEVPLSATGGDGTYLWSCLNGSVASVTQSGAVKTQAAGRADISAAMARNHHNRGMARVHVLPPRRLQIVQYALEAAVGSGIALHVAMYADTDNGTQMPFTRCDGIPFVIDVAESNFKRNLTAHVTPASIACATLVVVGSSPGASLVTISYTGCDGVTLSDSVTVAAYAPLSALHPASGETVLAVGSSRLVVFSGGPKPWLGRANHHTSDLTANGVSLTSAARPSDQSDVYIFDILCVAIGQVQLRLTVTNTPAMKYGKRANCSATIRVYCAKPRSIQLRPHLAIASPEKCPMNLDAERFVAQNHKDVELTVIVKDKLGRQFDNITSLLVNWKVSDSALGEVAAKGTTLAETLTDNKIVLPKRYYQKILTKGRTGTLEVSATVTDYQAGQLKSLQIEPDRPAFGVANEDGVEMTPDITASLSIILVGETRIVPDRTTVFCHPDNKVYLQVSQGSGFYEFILNYGDIANVSFDVASSSIAIVPIKPGVLELALVDVCLAVPNALAKITVVGVGSILLDVPDRVEKGKCVTATVKLLDDEGNAIALPQSTLLQLISEPQSGLITVVRDQREGEETEATFQLTGMMLGDTALAFSAGAVRSVLAPVQVFPPLRLFPRNVTLVAGAIFQVSHVGGPQPDATVDWSMSGVVAGVGATGVVEGLRHGTTTLTARAVGLSASTGQRIVYSQDSIEIHVVPLLGVRIVSPITRMRTGTTMPVWVTGVPDQITPLMLGAARLPLSFSWSATVRDIGHLHHAFSHTGVEVVDEDRISMRLTAAKPGRTVLHVMVTVPAIMTGTSTDKVLVDSLEVEVFEDLRLTRPPLATHPQAPLILIAPGSSVQLRTNREASSQLQYSVLDHGVPGPALPSHRSEVIRGLPVVRVDSHGLVESLGNPGRAVVEVSAREEFGLKQSLTVTIEVKPVSYILLGVDTEWRAPPDEVTRRLPQGLQLRLMASYHDNTGAVFTAAPSNLRMRTNRYDLISLARGDDNTTMSLQLLRNGSTMLKVWDDVTSLRLADYVKISTEDIIFPRKALLTVGDTVCLSPLARDGRWSSDNEAVLRLDPDTGSGIATGAGSAMVRFHYSADIYVNSDVEVQPLHQVKFLSGGTDHVSNASPNTMFSSPLVLRGASDPTSKLTNLVQPRSSPCTPPSTLPFTCSVAFTSGATCLEVLAVYPALDLVTGTYSCDIISAGPATLATSTLATNVSLRATSGGRDSSVTMVFHPAFFVHEPEVRVTSRGVGKITVSATPAVLASIQLSSDSGPMAVDPRDYLLNSKVAIPVQVSTGHGKCSAKRDQFIVIESPLTRQSVKVPVRVSSSGADPTCLGSDVDVDLNIGPMAEEFYGNRHLVLAIVILVGTFLVFKWCYTQLNQPLPNRVVSGTPSNVANYSLDETRRVGSPFSDHTPVYGSPRLSFQSPGAHRFQ